jgi:hypothetical protein
MHPRDKGSGFRLLKVGFEIGWVEVFGVLQRLV